MKAGQHLTGAYELWTYTCQALAKKSQASSTGASCPEGAHLRVRTLLVPELDGVLVQDVGVVQDADHRREQLQQLWVLVAVHLRSHHKQ